MQDDDNWARESLREIALEGIRERRRARRWGIFFKLLVLLYLFALLFFSTRPLLGLAEDRAVGPHTAVVKVEGPIMADSAASADRVLAGLQRAFEAENAQGVMLEINSPGGSPVESSRIYQGIMALRAANPDMPVHVVAGDSLASGAYYVAAAADGIHVDGATVVGSIGVISRGFGFTDAIDRLGIERRTYAAGDAKSALDPFEAPDPEAVEHLQTMLDDIHAQFIAAVREGRGDRLTDENEAIFSGRIWTGRHGIELGLADALGTPQSVATTVIGAERRVDYTPPRNLLERVFERMGGAAARVWVQMQQPGWQT